MEGITKWTADLDNHESRVDIFYKGKNSYFNNSKRQVHHSR